jgi:hypothetical protein
MKKILSVAFFLLTGVTSFAQSIDVKTVAIEAGGQAKVALDIAGAQNCNAAGMYITLPEGFKFVYDEAAGYLAGGEVCGTTHQVLSRLQAPRRLKFAAVSMKNASFQARDGQFAEATIAADADLPAGTYEGAIRGVEFSGTGNSGLATQQDVPFRIVVAPATAIEAIQTDASQISEVYSTAGAVQSGLQQGVNIVRYKSGEVKKVVVK